MPAAADEVSTSIAHLFSQHAVDYQALAGRAAAFQEQFGQHLKASAHSYASAEAVNVSSLLGNLLTTLSTEWRQVVWPLVRPLVQPLIIDLLNGYVDLLFGYAGVLQNLALLPSTIKNPFVQALAAAVITRLIPLFNLLSFLLLLPLLPVFILG